MHQNHPRENQRNQQARRNGRNPLPIIFLLLAGIVVIAGVILLLIWPRAQEWRMEQLTLRYEDIIQHYSEENGLDPFLVKGLIQAESSFNAQAVSPVGAAGVMQIMPRTAEWLAELMGVSYTHDDLFNPAYNIRMGTFYLRMLLDMFEHQDTALAAYNAGMGNVGNWLADERYSLDGETLYMIPFAETREYVERVNRFMELFRERYGE